ncbi:YfjI family protein [Paracoccus aestuarii]|nr:YfjI family protein [Paracoccus aestuarii]
MTLAPIAIPAQSALSVASLAVQGFADVETLGGDRPLSLYALTIARSGERKSTCDGLLMQGLRDFEREEAGRHREDVKAWMTRHALWKVQHDGVIASVKGKAGKNAKTQSEAQADLAALGDEPIAPPSPERTVTEPTYEGLTRKFAEGMPSLGIFSDEGGQFLGGFAMSSDNRQKTLAALNDLWQGNPIRRTRQGEGSFTLYGRRLAVHLMVQPGVARDFMADPKTDDTGFLPRFLICEPPSTIGTRLHGLTRDGTGPLAAFAARLGTILQSPLPMNPESRALEPRRLLLAPDARALLTEYADAVELSQRPGAAMSSVTGYASKAAEQACRIAGVLTLWRDLAAPAVEAEDMVSGIELAGFYLSEAQRLADAAKVSEETDRAERLRRWLIEEWPDPEMLTGDVVQKAPIRALRETKTATAALEMLERHGWVIALPTGTVVRGRARSTAWRIVKGGSHAV